MKSIGIVSLKCYNRNGDDMERREAKEITLDLLLGDQNINADFYASLFNKYRCGDSENTPISPAGMQTVNERNNEDQLVRKRDINEDRTYRGFNYAE